MARELNFTELKNFCNAGKIMQTEISNACLPTEIIGQARAERALNFGLNIKTKGYNIYVSGESGTGKTSFAKKFAESIAAAEKIPPDLCYIYNFRDPRDPKLLKLPAGKGKVFVEEMEDLIDILSNELPKAFTSSSYDLDKNEIVKTYSEKRDEIIKKITEEAKEQNFGVKMSNTGIYFVPEIDGEMISEEQFEELSNEQKENITENSEAIQSKAVEVMRAMREFERDTRTEIEGLDYNIALFIIGRHIGKLQKLYEDNLEVLDYLVCVKEDLLENINEFIEEESEEEESSIQALLPWYSKKSQDDLYSKYKVNLITDNSDLKAAPVIVEYNPTYINLVGEIEYDNEYGNLTTDFMKIKSGVFHKANGGYLILQAHDVLTHTHAWETMRRILKTGEVVIEPLREYSSSVIVSGVKPEALDLDVKIIMIGTSFYYDLFYEYDEEFEKLFKINVQFDYEMNLTDENIASVKNFVKDFVTKENVADFDAAAIAKIIEYSSRLVERKNKLSTRFGKITELLVEASTWARLDNQEIINAEYIQKAIDEKEYRNNLYEEKLSEMIDDELVMIDTEGKKIAQINGLAVLDTGDHVFAKPSRITATSYVGKLGIVNIEEEAEMSGNIHNKGVQVLIGYLGQTYAQDFPLSLSCRICFEQNYNGIDGDSASSTELYAILSSLAELPINQELAVTGSMNQRGEIQAIGGVTYKIEGFYELCEKRGLTGSQGVIIPAQNVQDLVLKDNVIDAVKRGDFHIYAIRHIDEGIELLTGLKAGIKNEKGKYPSNSVHGKVMKRLKDFSRKSAAE